MAELYLITGFLGAGKTTFLKGLIPQLRAARLHLIVNEYGKEGVDGSLLRELGATLDEINNGSIFCTCRLDQFESVLASALQQQPDCIVVEASGLADPTNIRGILRQERFARQVDYRGCICLVDAVRFEKVYTTARCCKKQLAASDLILINKVDLVSPEQAEAVAETVRRHRPDLPIHLTNRARMQPEWLRALRPVGQGPDMAPTPPDISLQKLLVTVREDCGPAQLRHVLQLLAEDSYRIKGFVRLEGSVYLADCVGMQISLEPYSGPEAGCVGVLNILSGQGMPLRGAIKRAATLYPETIALAADQPNSTVPK